MTEDPKMAPEADYYAPNQQVVRGDMSGPAEEGEGGSLPITDENVPGPQAEPEPEAEPEDKPAAKAGRGK